MFDRSSVDTKCDEDMNKRSQGVVSSNELIYHHLLYHTCVVFFPSHYCELIFHELDRQHGRNNNDKLKNPAIHQNHNYQDICVQLLIF